MQSKQAKKIIIEIKKRKKGIRMTKRHGSVISTPIELLTDQKLNRENDTKKKTEIEIGGYLGVENYTPKAGLYANMRLTKNTFFKII